MPLKFFNSFIQNTIQTALAKAFATMGLSVLRILLYNRDTGADKKHPGDQSLGYGFVQ